MLVAIYLTAGAVCAFFFQKKKMRLASILYALLTGVLILYFLLITSEGFVGILARYAGEDTLDLIRQAVTVELFPGPVTVSIMFISNLLLIFNVLFASALTVTHAVRRIIRALNTFGVVIRQKLLKADEVLHRFNCRQRRFIELCRMNN